MRLTAQVDVSGLRAAANVPDAVLRGEHRPQGPRGGDVLGVLLGPVELRDLRVVLEPAGADGFGFVADVRGGGDPFDGVGFVGDEREVAQRACSVAVAVSLSWG
jgi:hypothetical protein